MQIEKTKFNKKRKSTIEDMHNMCGNKKRNFVKDMPWSVEHCHQKVSKSFCIKNKRLLANSKFGESEQLNNPNETVLKNKKKGKDVNKPLNCLRKEKNSTEEKSDGMKASNVHTNSFKKKKRKKKNSDKMQKNFKPDNYEESKFSEFDLNDSFMRDNGYTHLYTKNNDDNNLRVKKCKTIKNKNLNKKDVKKVTETKYVGNKIDSTPDPSIENQPHVVSELVKNNNNNLSDLAISKVFCKDNVLVKHPIDEFKSSMNPSSPHSDLKDGSFLINKMLSDLQDDQKSISDSMSEVESNLIDRETLSSNKNQLKFGIDQPVTYVEETSEDGEIKSVISNSDHVSVGLVYDNSNLPDLTNSKIFHKDKEMINSAKDSFKSSINPSSLHFPSQNCKLINSTQTKNTKTDTADYHIKSEAEHTKLDSKSFQNMAGTGNEQFYIFENKLENSSFALLPGSLFSSDNVAKVVDAQFFYINPSTHEALTKSKYLFVNLNPSNSNMKQSFHDKPISNSIGTQTYAESETSNSNVKTNTIPDLKEACVKEKLDSPRLPSDAVIKRPIIFNFDKNQYTIIKNFNRGSSEDSYHAFKQTKIEDYLKPKKAM